MPQARLIVAALALALVVINAPGETRFVNLDNATPSSPFTNWTSAATSIQDAVDASVAGDEIIVTNGTYRTGGRTLYLTMTNRVAVTTPVTVRSVNGPEVTFIEGHQVPGLTNGAGAVRCLYLTDGATMIGFTLTNGATITSGVGVSGKSGGGVLCASSSAVLSNCVIVGNSAAFDGGGVYSGTLQFCKIEKNRTVQNGGGVRESLLLDCVISGNYAAQGGGMHSARATNCILKFNSSWNGGGAYGGLLVSCMVISNSAASGLGRGGGISGSSGLNCFLFGNSSDLSGGGAYGSTLTNCAIFQNTTSGSGGGTSLGTLVNCTVNGNYAPTAGGTFLGSAANCIIYENVAQTDPNYSGGSLNYCCTFPLPNVGVGNFTNIPQLVDPLHVSGDSPCIGAGNGAYASGLDIDGESWNNPPPVGCDEYHSGSITGLVSVALSASYTNVATGFLVNLRGDITGHASANRWELGDGTVLSNRVNFFYSWNAPGAYSVVLRVYNESQPSGISATSIVHILDQPLHYVSAVNPTPLSPYLSWSTAATNIQDAVDAAFAGGTVIVTNGVYDKGGRAVHKTLTNRVAVTKPLTLSAVNGPQVTVIRGYQSPSPASGVLRCVYLGNDTRLVGFTLIGGAVSETSSPNTRSPSANGGGIWCDSTSAIVDNCIILSNSAYSGGGASGGTFTNCTFIRNTAWGWWAGGVEFATLYNCIVSSNSAGVSGGGTYSSTLNNCMVKGNSAVNGAGGGTYECVLRSSTLDGNKTLHPLAAGGAAYESHLDKCLVVGNQTAGRGGGLAQGTAVQSIFRNNTANTSGGGAYFSTLTNCTVVGNTAALGGGVDGGMWFNSIIYFNSSTNGENYSSGVIANCCSTPLSFAGNARNFTNAPQFVSLATGDLRLLPDSPCINAGYNDFAPVGTDLDGHERIVGGTADVGAYEFQSPGSVISYAYLHRFGLPANGSVDFLDLDEDSFNTWQEWQAFTDPTDPQSFLHLLPPTVTASGISLQWVGVLGRSYFIEKSTNLNSIPTFYLLRTNVPGPNVTGNLGTFTDTNRTWPSSFYRLGVVY